MTTIDQPETVFDFVKRCSRGQLQTPSRNDFLAMDLLLCAVFDSLHAEETEALKEDRIELAAQERFEQRYHRWLEAANSLLAEQESAIAGAESPLLAKIVECQEVLREFGVAREGEEAMEEFFEDEAKLTD